jgi:hypothetical protein
MSEGRRHSLQGRLTSHMCFVRTPLGFSARLMNRASGTVDRSPTRPCASLAPCMLLGQTPTWSYLMHGFRLIPTTEPVDAPTCPKGSRHSPLFALVVVRLRARGHDITRRLLVVLRRLIPNLWHHPGQFFGRWIGRYMELNWCRWNYQHRHSG